MKQEKNASTIHVGDGDGGMMTRLIVTGPGHEAAAEKWAAEYNDKLRNEQKINGMDEQWYMEESAIVCPAFVATADTMPPVEQ